MRYRGPQVRLYSDARTRAYSADERARERRQVIEEVQRVERATGGERRDEGTGSYTVLVDGLPVAVVGVWLTDSLDRVVEARTPSGAPWSPPRVALAG